METGGPRSLAFLAQKACIKYLKRINDIGDCPYELIRPVLLKLENPDQLHQIEINSPQIIGHDGEIWLHFIKRDIPDWDSKPHEPKDPKNWWKVYKQLKEQTQRDRAQGAEKLKAALDSINDEKEQNLAKVVSRKDLPREPANHRARTLHSSNNGKAGSKSGHKLSLLERIRKETRDARDARLARASVPASQLTKKPTEVKKAPPGLVEQYKRSNLQKASIDMTARPPAAPRVPRPPLVIARSEKPASDNSFQVREDRLRALTLGKTVKATASPDRRLTSTDQQSKAPTTPKSSSGPIRQVLPSDDLMDGGDLEGQQQKSRDIHSTSKTQPATTLDGGHPQKPLMGTPPLSRFGSPGPPGTGKRKAPPSIFMTPNKKPRPGGGR